MNPDLYVVLHIPKTAGSTLRANFIRNFKKAQWMSVLPEPANRRCETIVRAVDEVLAEHDTSRTRCVFGHWAYWGIHQKVRPTSTPAYITFLREPVERGISLYGFLKSRPGTTHHRFIRENNWTIAQWIEGSSPVDLNNAQLRRLLFDGHSEVLTEPNLTRDHLEAAKERLRQFWFVGLTETFETDSLYLYGQLNFRWFCPQRVVNATPNKPIASPQDIAALQAATRLDSELYLFARELREEWRRDHAREVRLQTRKARVWRSFNQQLHRLKQKVRPVPNP